ncbi:unnamed protein product [Symbiodinium sp. CCMP2592]|nr:unnamed protein product [Symbiodinium sp. CCMP2592]
MSLHVDDLIISGTPEFLTWFLKKIQEHFTVGHEDKNDFTFIGQRVLWVLDAQGKKKYISIDQKLYVSELEEIVIPKHLKDADACDKELSTLLGSINWLQSRAQFQACYQFSRLASASAAPTVGHCKELNKLCRQIRSEKVELRVWPLGPAPFMDRDGESSTSDFEVLSAHLSDLQQSHELLQHRVLYLEGRIRDLEEGAAFSATTLSGVQNEQQQLASRLSWLERFSNSLIAFVLRVMTSFVNDLEAIRLASQSSQDPPGPSLVPQAPKCTSVATPVASLERTTGQPPNQLVHIDAEEGLPKASGKLSASFLEHLDKLHCESSDLGGERAVVQPADGQLRMSSVGLQDSPAKSGSSASWDLIAPDSLNASSVAVPLVCTVKRYRKTSLPVQETPADVSPVLLQVRPKSSGYRSRSRSEERAPLSMAGSGDGASHVDHRHKLSIGSKIPLGPFRPLPAPAPVPRSRVASPSVGGRPGLCPPVPRAKNRAAFYAKHNRVPLVGGTHGLSVPAAVSKIVSPAGAGVSGSASRGTRNSLQAPSPVVGRAAKSGGLTLQQSVHQHQFASVLVIWELVKPLVLPFSPVLQDLQSSVRATDLELGLLRTVAESTALRYLQVVHKFLDQLRVLWNLSWDSASQSAVVDCIVSLRRDHQDCHQLNAFKALRWLAKLLRLQVDNLYDGLFKPLVNVASSGKLRRESYPLPWRLVSFFEQALIFRTLPVPALLLAGAALSCIFGSLRWSDSQHLRWDSIVFSASCVRALIFRTKTSRAGMPVGFRVAGVRGAEASVMQSWVAHYLELLPNAWVEMRAAFGELVCPDCLWFSWDSQSATFAPLSYAQCLRFLRESAVAAGLSEGVLEAPNCTADVVLAKVQAGWLPLTPLARGGQVPIQQALRGVQPCASLASCFPLLPDFSAAHDPEAAAVTMMASQVAAADTLSEPTQAPSQTPAAVQDFDSSSSDGEPADVESLGDAEEVCFLRAKSGIIHIASPAPSGTGVSCGSLWLKPACGMLSSELEMVGSVPTGARRGFVDTRRVKGALPVDPDPSVSTMASLLASHNIPEALHYHFAEFTPEIFANVATDAASLDRFLGSLVENLGADQFVVEARGMREDFLSSYPSELLSLEETPGSRLMALVYRGVSDKSLKWPQWKHRLSVAQEQAHQLSRPSKMPRLECLLFDDVPTKEVPHVLQYGYVSGILNMHATALALCKAAHLSVLKRYVRSFLRLCFPQLESGFRGPSVSEAITADEKAWQAINELYAYHDWDLGDAVAEIIDVRMTLHVYLQPRTS